MKSLEEAEVAGEATKAKKTLADGKAGNVVILHSNKITVQSYKKKSMWAMAGYKTHTAATWKALAEAILDVTR